MRRSVSKDKNHDSIANTLRGGGFSVGDVPQAGNSFPDLVVSSRFVTVLMEIKTPEGFFYAEQLDFLARWKGYCAFVTTPEEALRAMRDPERYCLSEREKEAIDHVVLRFRLRTKQRTKNPVITVAAFEKDIAKILDK